MELFIKKPAFNDRLLNKAVILNGHDVDGHEIKGIFIITKVETEEIYVTNGKSNFSIHKENFDRELLSITLMAAHEILSQK